MIKKALLSTCLTLALTTAVWADQGSDDGPGAASAHRRPHQNGMDASTVCKSGSRTVEFDYNVVTGALTDDVTFDNCVLANGTTVSGTTSTDGIILPTGEFTNQINVTDKVDTITTDKFGNTHTRTCTIVRDGVLDTRGFVFTGSITRTDCVISGALRERGNLIQHLLKQLTHSEEGDEDEAEDGDDDGAHSSSSDSSH